MSVAVTFSQSVQLSKQTTQHTEMGTKFQLLISQLL